MPKLHCPDYCWDIVLFTHLSQREDSALEEIPVPEANMPTDMVQPFETCQRAPAGKSQMSEQGCSEELMLILESYSQVNLYVAAKQK